MTHFWGGVAPTTLCGRNPLVLDTLPAWHGTPFHDGSFMSVDCTQCLKQRPSWMVGAKKAVRP